MELCIGGGGGLYVECYGGICCMMCGRGSKFLRGDGVLLAEILFTIVPVKTYVKCVF